MLNINNGIISNKMEERGETMIRKIRIRIEQTAKIYGKVSISPFEKHLLIFEIWAETKSKECLPFSSGVLAI